MRDPRLTSTGRVAFGLISLLLGVFALTILGKWA
jgi:hypothetical protein